MIKTIDRLHHQSWFCPMTKREWIFTEESADNWILQLCIIIMVTRTQGRSFRSHIFETTSILTETPYVEFWQCSRDNGRKPKNRQIHKDCVIVHALASKTAVNANKNLSKQLQYLSFPLSPTSCYNSRSYFLNHYRTKYKIKATYNRGSLPGSNQKFRVSFSRTVTPRRYDWQRQHDVNLMYSKY